MNPILLRLTLGFSAWDLIILAVAVVLAVVFLVRRHRLSKEESALRKRLDGSSEGRKN